jgi:hypothetical protein
MHVERWIREKSQIFNLNYKMKTGVGASHIEESDCQSVQTTAVPVLVGSVKMWTSDMLGHASQSQLLLHRDILSGAQAATASLLASTPSADISKTERTEPDWTARSRPTADTEKTGRLGVTRPPTRRRQRRLAGYQSPGRLHRESNEPARCGRSFRRYSSVAPCLRDTTLFRAHNISPVTVLAAHSACLPSYSSVYSSNSNKYFYRNLRRCLSVLPEQTSHPTFL